MEVSKPSRLRAGLSVAGIVIAAANLRGALTSVGPLVGKIRADTGISSGAAGLLIWSSRMFGGQQGCESGHWRGESRVSEWQTDNEGYDSAPKGAGRVALAQAEATTVPEGERSAPVLAHGSMLVRFYAPRGTDEQSPHTRDELYVVARGSGSFVNGEERHSFGEADVLFVPAGVEHRFEDFTEDFAVWVVFYGPEGGESADLEQGR